MDNPGNKPAEAESHVTRPEIFQKLFGSKQAQPGIQSRTLDTKWIGSTMKPITN